MTHPRIAFDDRPLRRADMKASPFELFAAWYDEALRQDYVESAAFLLSTADADGRPSARVLLLRGHDERGFDFYTNYESRKGREIAVNPQAAMTFWWETLGRQVRVEGRVEPLGAEESDAYFQRRPRGHQLSAWTSHQSEPVADRETLEREKEALADRFKGGPVPRPPHWGGYRLVPSTIEFWQIRPDRLHDRFRYTRSADGAWTIERLSP